MGTSLSYISFVNIFDDLILSALKTVFRIAQNNNVSIVIPNEIKNFVFEFSEFEFYEFEFSAFECFGSVSH